jgi:DNA-binding beta-propeller fold protein YncE
VDSDGALDVLTDRGSAPRMVHKISLSGQAQLGMTVTPDGRHLLIASVAGAVVVDVARAETGAKGAVIGTLGHGSQGFGGAIEVTLLAFSAAGLISDAKNSLLASVRVGAAPVGVAVVDDGSRVVVADSNRFGASGENAALTVVNATAALAGRSAIVGTVRAQQFPRDVAIEPAGTVLLVSNYGSGTLEAVHVADHAQESHG